MTEKYTEELSDHYHLPTLDAWKNEQIDTQPDHLSGQIRCLDLTQGLPSLKKGTSWGFLGFTSEVKGASKPDSLDAVKVLRNTIGSMPLTEAAEFTFYDLGTILYSDDHFALAEKAMTLAISRAIGAGLQLILLGDSHKMAWSNYQGITSAYPQAECATVTFSSRLNSESCSEENSKGSPPLFMRIADACKKARKKYDSTYFGVHMDKSTSKVLSLADQSNIKMIFADEFHVGGIEASLEAADDIITRSNLIYVSICLDVFASAFAPGVSDPEPLGLLPWQVIPALRRFADSNKVVILEVSGLNPALDSGGLTAKLGTSVIFDFIHQSAHLNKS